MQIISKQGQWLGDIAIRYAGSFEAIVDIAVQNDVSVTDILDIGTLIAVPAISDKRTVNYFERNAIEPATELQQNRLEGIGVWRIGVDFVVS